MNSWCLWAMDQAGIPQKYSLFHSIYEYVSWRQDIRLDRVWSDHMAILTHGSAAPELSFLMMGCYCSPAFAVVRSFFSLLFLFSKLVFHAKEANGVHSYFSSLWRFSNLKPDFPFWCAQIVIHTIILIQLLQCSYFLDAIRGV